MPKNNRALAASPITSMIAKQYRATTYDPTMQQVALLIRNSNLSLRLLSNRCGVSIECMRRWLNGETRRPQALTLKFVLRALGYDLKVTPAAGHNSALRTDDDE